MSDHPSLPKAQVPPIIAAKAVEEQIEKLEFRRASGQGPTAAPQRPTPPPQPPSASEPPPEAKHASRLDEQFSIGRVMKALFPDGIQIADEEQFATMRLFNAMVASVAQFAQSNMTSSNHIRDVSRQAEMLDEMVRRRTRG
jgi:hypothetical protein